MQTTLLGLAITLILALLTALIGPLFIDWNSYRPVFESQASALVGLPVKVTGAIDVRLLPSPSLVLNGIEIGETMQTIQARALGIEFALPPLFSGQLRATEMRVVGLDLKLGLDGSGRASLPNAAAGFNIDALSIDRLEIEDARLAFTDAASGSRMQLDQLAFTGEVRALRGPFKGEGTFVRDNASYKYRIAAGRPEPGGLRIKAGIETTDRPLSVDADGLLAMEAGAPRFDGAITVAKPVTATSSDGRTLVNEPWRATARVKAGPAQALFEQLEFQHGPDERALKLTGTAEAKFGAQPQVNAVLSARQLDIDRLLVGSDGARGTPREAVQAAIARLNTLPRSPIPVQVGIGVDAATLGGGALQNLRGDIVTEGDAWTLSDLEVRAPGFTQIQATGRLGTAPGQPAFKGAVDVSSVDPRAFMAWLDGRSDPALADGRSIRARGNLTLGGGLIAFEGFNAQFDRKTVEGNLVYAFADQAGGAKLDADIRAEDLDIDAALEFGAAALAGQPVERPKDISLTLALGRARYLGVEVERASGKLAFDAKGLLIQRLSIGEFGGMTIDAQGRVDTVDATPRGAIAVSIDARDLSGLNALAQRFTPQASGVVTNVTGRLGPGKLKGNLVVGPADNPASGQSKAKLDAAGNFGALRMQVVAEATGTMPEMAKAEIRLDANVESADANTLIRLLGADGVLVSQAQPGKLSVTASGPLTGNLRANARLDASDLDIAADGQVQPSADQGPAATFALTVGKANLMPLRAGSRQRAEPLPVKFTARANVNRQAARFENVVADIAGTAMRGRLSVAFGATPVVDGEIDLTALDVAALTAVAIGMPPVQSERETWPAAPFSQGLMPNVGGQLNVKAARAQLAPGTVATNVRTTLQLAPSRFAFEKIEAELLGGRASGELSFRKNVDGVAMQGRISFNGADASKAVPGEGAPVTGRVSLQVEFDGGGLSPKALIGSMTGAGTIALEAGRIAGLDAKVFSAAIQRVDQGLPLEPAKLRDMVATALDAGPLMVPSADAAISITSGQVRLGSFVARAEGADLALSGSYDLAASTLDLRVMLAGAQVAPSSAGRPEISMALRGPAMSPRRTLDVSALAGWLALRSVDQQTKKLEAIERAGPMIEPPALAPVAPTAPAVAPPLPERAPVVPRPRPSTAAEQPPPAPKAAPLPPPIDISPVPVDRRSDLR